MVLVCGHSNRYNASIIIIVVVIIVYWSSFKIIHVNIMRINYNGSWNSNTPCWDWERERERERKVTRERIWQNLLSNKKKNRYKYSEHQKFKFFHLRRVPEKIWTILRIPFLIFLLFILKTKNETIRHSLEGSVLAY